MLRVIVAQSAACESDNHKVPIMIIGIGSNPAFEFRWIKFPLLIRDELRVPLIKYAKI